MGVLEVGGKDKARKGMFILDSAVGNGVERSVSALYSEDNRLLPLSSHFASVHGRISGDKTQQPTEHHTSL